MILNFLENTFLNAEMSRADFLDLIGTSLHLMEGQNENGRYDAQISALRPHHDAYSTLLARQRQSLIARHGQVRTVGQVIDDAIEFATKTLHKEAAYHLGENSIAYGALFPNGRTEFHKLTNINAASVLETLTDEIEGHRGELGPKADELLTKAGELEDELDAAATAKGQHEGEVQGASTREKKLRAAAARQLKLNLLDQCKMHIDDNDQVRALYDPKFLNWHAKPAEKKPSSGTQG